MSRKSVVITLSVAIFIIVATILILIQNTGKTDGDPWEMIPDKAALIIEIDSPGNVINTIKDNNSIWQNLLKINIVENLDTGISLLDTILIGSEYSELFRNKPLTIAFYADSNSIVETLILSRTESSLDINVVKDFLYTEFSSGYEFFNISGKHESFKIIDREGLTSCFSTINGVFVYSSSEKLLSKLYDTFDGDLPKLTDDITFVNLKKSSGAKVKARIFIQYSELANLIYPLVSHERYNALQWLKSFARWTEVDILLKDDEIIFSGFSIARDNYLSSIRDQKPVKIKALNIIPYNANTIVWLGFSSFNSYFNDNNSESKAKLLSSKLNFDINKLINVVGEEITFASNAVTSASFNDNSWFIVKVKNKNDASAILKRIALNTGVEKTTKHNAYEITRINNMSFIPDIFGNAFKVINKNFYTFIGDYAVFANSSNSLINLIDFVETGKTLDLNDNFKVFSDNISSTSNLLLYVQPGEILGRLEEYLKDNVVEEFHKNKKAIVSFQGMAMQVSSGDPLSFTNFYVKYSEKQLEENLALWKVQLDDDIAWGPYLVSNHQTKNQNIIVFDKRGSMYLIDFDGRILWKKKIDNTPISDIYQIDYYKNRKIQYLFNTGDFIYLIDRKGENVSGYPKKLHSKATNGLAVFDYLKNKDYRLLVAQSDKRIYNYTIKGNEVKGWSQSRMQNIVVEPVKRLLANKKDYIIISDIEDEIKIVDRKGKSRIKLKGRLKKAKNSDYYVNQTNSKGIIITTDEKGRLVYISSRGKIQYTDFGDFGPNHFFLYEDFNNDESKDFIFIDGGNLTVFDRFKKVLASYNFGSEITIEPSFFNLGSKQHVLGVVADKERTIYLFDSKGNIIISKGLVGETPFTVGSLEDNNKINLVSAAGSVLYNYRLK